MAKSSEKSDKPSEGKTEGGSQAAAPAPQQQDQQQQQQAQQSQVKIDDANAISSYSNFCRVTGAFEELIIDYGMTTQPAGATPQTIKIDQRIILNYYTAKRLLHALNMSIQRHESVFGVLETDIQKRVQRPAGSQT